MGTTDPTAARLAEVVSALVDRVTPTTGSADTDTTDTTEEA